MCPSGPAVEDVLVLLRMTRQTITLVNTVAWSILSDSGNGLLASKLTRLAYINTSAHAHIHKFREHLIA